MIDSFRAQPHGLLRRVLRKAGASEYPEGRYIPSENLRELVLGDDHTTTTSRMVGWHEALHAVLNGSTTFGNLMVVASALDAAGDPGFDKLVDAMISYAWTTHETYATVASLYPATKGGFDRRLLTDYVEYLKLFDQFDQIFDLSSIPHVGSICIDATARVAMQTPTINWFLESDCSDWVGFSWSQLEQPDIRFAQFLENENANRLRAAVIGAMEAGPETFRQIVRERMQGEAALELVRQTSVADQDALSEIAFNVAASILSQRGFETLKFDEQRSLAASLIGKVEAYASGRLKTSFHVPENLEDDRDAIVSDFRREMLTIYRHGQAAGFLECSATDRFLLDSFEHECSEFRYFEISVMPKAKILALYEPVFDAELLDPHANLVFALRRRIKADEVWSNGLIEYAVMKSSDQLKEIRSSYPQHKVFMSVSARTFHETSFFRNWEGEGLSALIDGYLVVIDMDPFFLLKTLSEKETVAVNRGNARIQEGEETRTLEFFCLSTASRANLVHFSPCSGPFLDALTTYCQNGQLNTVLGGGLAQEHNDLLKLLAGHVVREEPRFGFDFWE